METIVARMGDTEIFLPNNHKRFEETINEPWAWQNAVPWYEAQLEIVLENLKGSGQCLVIGSPMFEVAALMDQGWDVIYSDVRQPPAPPCPIKFCKADATDLPFDDCSFDGLSSTCVLCHAGLGRYGDIVHNHGDSLALNEMVRVLKPGAKAIIMFGTHLPIIEATVSLGTSHRIYARNDVLGMIARSGAKLIELKTFCNCCNQWLTEEDAASHIMKARANIHIGGKDMIPYCYLTGILEKP